MYRTATLNQAMSRYGFCPPEATNQREDFMGKQINNAIQRMPVPPLAKGLLNPQMELSSIKLITNNLL